MGTWWMALLGGVLIGGSAGLLYLLHGRIAGISGVLGAAMMPETSERAWRVAFVVGLVAVGLVARLAAPETVPLTGTGTSTPLLVLAGLLVGFGTRLGNGCTSGHGVCGVGRAAPR
ncbi:MAG: YeeE/YedE family protein, partial [Myxococcales bacterium]|nr:YeeE/YedE family protein [Myxococcales bacterium]